MCFCATFGEGLSPLPFQVGDRFVVLALFPGSRFSREPLNIWNSQAQLLYTNWLNYYVYQTTPYDIERVGE